MRRTPLSHIFVLFAFLANTFGPIPASQAQDFRLPEPGVMVPLSPEFLPAVLKGIKVNPNNPFRFDFILDQGDAVIARSEATKQSLKEESTKLIKYFLASLTIPEKDLWVNLSPYEKNRIIPNSFGLTEMGRDLLAQDYMLKQITASLIYPEGETGKRFWKRIYEEAQAKYHTSNIPVNTFNKVWIMPEKAVVYENAQAGAAYVVEAKLKVMLEQDYLSLEKHEAIQKSDINALGSTVVREIVIPELTKEVNEGKNFSQLRQVYNSLILATWYKKKIKDSILAQVYENKKKIAGIGYGQTSNVESIYQRYLQAFKKGVYNYIKEEPDLMTNQPTPRKYFSGGMDMAQLGQATTGVLQVTNNKAKISKTQTTLFHLSVVLNYLLKKNKPMTDIKPKQREMTPDETAMYEKLMDRLKQMGGSRFITIQNFEIKQATPIRKIISFDVNYYSVKMATMHIEMDTLANNEKVIQKFAFPKEREENPIKVKWMERFRIAYGERLLALYFLWIMDTEPNLTKFHTPILKSEKFFEDLVRKWKKDDVPFDHNLIGTFAEEGEIDSIPTKKKIFINLALLDKQKIYKTMTTKVTINKDKIKTTISKLGRAAASIKTLKRKMTFIKVDRNGETTSQIAKFLNLSSDSEQVRFIASTFPNNWQEAMSLIGLDIINPQRMPLITRLAQRGLEPIVIADVIAYRSASKVKLSFEDFPIEFQDFLINLLGNKEGASRLNFDKLFYWYFLVKNASSQSLLTNKALGMFQSIDDGLKQKILSMSPDIDLSSDEALHRNFDLYEHSEQDSLYLPMTWGPDFWRESKALWISSEIVKLKKRPSALNTDIWEIRLAKYPKGKKWKIMLMLKDISTLEHADEIKPWIINYGSSNELCAAVIDFYPEKSVAKIANITSFLSMGPLSLDQLALETLERYLIENKMASSIVAPAGSTLFYDIDRRLTVHRASIDSYNRLFPSNGYEFGQVQVWTSQEGDQSIRRTEKGPGDLGYVLKGHSLASMFVWGKDLPDEDKAMYSEASDRLYQLSVLSNTPPKSNTQTAQTPSEAIMQEKLMSLVRQMQSKAGPFITIKNLKWTEATHMFSFDVNYLSEKMATMYIEIDNLDPTSNEKAVQKFVFSKPKGKFRQRYGERLIALFFLWMMDVEPNLTKFFTPYILAHSEDYFKDLAKKWKKDGVPFDDNLVGIVPSRGKFDDISYREKLFMDLTKLDKQKIYQTMIGKDKPRIKTILSKLTRTAAAIKSIRGKMTVVKSDQNGETITQIAKFLNLSPKNYQVQFIASRFPNNWQEAMSLIGPDIANLQRRPLIMRLAQRNLPPVVIADVVNYRSIPAVRISKKRPPEKLLFEDFPIEFQDFIMDLLGPKRGVSRLNFDNLFYWYYLVKNPTAQSELKEKSLMMLESINDDQRTKIMGISPDVDLRPNSRALHLNFALSKSSEQGLIYSPMFWGLDSELWRSLEQSWLSAEIVQLKDKPSILNKGPWEIRLSKGPKSKGWQISLVLKDISVLGLNEEHRSKLEPWMIKGGLFVTTINFDIKKNVAKIESIKSFLPLINKMKSLGAMLGAVSLEQLVLQVFEQYLREKEKVRIILAPTGASLFFDAEYSLHRKTLDRFNQAFSDSFTFAQIPEVWTKNPIAHNISLTRRPSTDFNKGVLGRRKGYHLAPMFVWTKNLPDSAMNSRFIPFGVPDQIYPGLDEKTILRFAQSMDITKGGMERYISRLDQELLKKNRVTIIRIYLTKDKKEKIVREKFEQGTLITVPVVRFSKTTITALGWIPLIGEYFTPTSALTKRLAQILKEQKVDVIVNHSPTLVNESLAIYALGNQHQIPVVIMNHLANNKLSQDKNKPVVEAANHIATVSNVDIPNSLVEKTTNLRDGINMDFWNPKRVRKVSVDALREELRIKPDEKVIVLPARIHRLKGQWDFLDVVAKLKEKFDKTGIKFQVFFVGPIGSSHFKQEIEERIAKYGLTSVVHMTGYYDAVKLREMYQLSDVVVLPSREEGTGRVLLEAQAMEKPVIANDLTGMKEAVWTKKNEETGFLVPYQDASPVHNDIFVGHLEYLLTHEEERIAMGKRGRLWVQDDKNGYGGAIASLARRHTQFYLRVIHGDAAQLTTDNLLDGLTILRFTLNKQPGGLPVYIAKLNQELLQRNKMTIIDLYYTKDSQEKERISKIGQGTLIEIPVLKFSKNKKFMLKVARRLSITGGHQTLTGPLTQAIEQVLRTYNVDLIVNHAPDLGDELLVLNNAGNRHKIPVIAQNHIRNQNLLNWPAIKDVKHIATVSGIGIPVSFKDKTTNLKDGIDMNFWDPKNVNEADVNALRKELMIKPDEKVIVLPARIYRIKGQEDFLKVIKRLKESGTKFKIFFVGPINSGHYKNDIEKTIVKYGLTGTVHMTGGYDPIKLRTMYQLSDVVVLPSKEEGLGGVLLEAQAMQKPVVAYAVDGIPEAFLDQETGYLIPYQDYDLFTQTLIYLLSNDQEARNMGIRGRQFIKREYTIQALAQRHAQFYSDVLKNPAQISSKSNTGGIDLSSNKFLQTQAQGVGIKFHIDPAMLQELQNAPGFVPVVIDIQPMTDLSKFLGISR
jgi:glycosyltransferase involved in cell wall biosynthesis